MINYRFKGNESFYIRTGWFEKALTVMNENKDVNVFSSANGVSYLGVGSNMVSSIRYWMIAAGLLEKQKNIATDLSKLIYEIDPYFEDINTWWIIHYNLATNLIDCPVNYAFFNLVDRKKATREEFAKIIYSAIKDKCGIEAKEDYIKSDLSVCIRSYSPDEIIEEWKTPEDNYTCPLWQLGLLRKIGQNEVVKTEPSLDAINYKVVYLSLLRAFEDVNGFTIDDALSKEKGPGVIFNISRSTMISLIEKMQKQGLVSFNRTAGLNTVYFEKKKKDNEVVKDILNE